MLKRDWGKSIRSPTSLLQLDIRLLISFSISFYTSFLIPFDDQRTNPCSARINKNGTQLNRTQNDAEQKGTT